MILGSIACYVYSGTIEKFVKEILVGHEDVLYVLKYMINNLKFSRGNIHDYIAVLCTIVAAVVVLYYTLQDTHREGIPHRKVIAYFIGSASIPTLFFIQLIMTGLMSLHFVEDRYVLLLGFSAATFFLQFIILYVIILSSTSSFCRQCIKKTEYDQFHYLMKYSVENKQYVWNYFVHHMPQVLAGEEMIFDKAISVSSLLSVPLDYKKSERIERDEKSNNKWKVFTYEYYFRNVLMSFEQLASSREDSNQIFETIYEFVECLQNNKDIDINDRLLVISAILNAAQTSGIMKAEAFCCHIINNIGNERADEYDWHKKLIFLYLLYLDHLFRTEEEKVQINELLTIDGIKELEFVNDDIYTEFWCIWTTQSDLPWERSIDYLIMALEGLLGIRGVSTVIDFYHYIINRDKEEFKCE